MPLPENFNSVHHLKQVLMKTRNKLVRDYFREDIDENDLATNEGALKRACLIDEDDTIDIINLKTNLFYLDCGVGYQKFRDEGYYVPKIDFHETYRFKPQVQLKFQETNADRKRFKRKDPKRFRFSYRIINETSTSISEVQVNQIRNKINLLFPETWEHYAGLNSYILFKSEKYEKPIKVPARTASEAKEFIDKLLDLIGINISYSTTDLKVIESPIQEIETKIILGDSYKTGSTHPTADIKLRQAVLMLHGKTTDRVLVSRNL